MTAPTWSFSDSSKIARLEREVAELTQQPAAEADTVETEAVHEKKHGAVA